MAATLYGITHSHSAVAARLMLEHAGVEHQVRNLFPGLHPVIVRASGFPGWTVPALRIDGRRVQGTLAISQELHRLRPDASLFPDDTERRDAVEKAERWGHDELQPIARRAFRWAGMRSQAVRVWLMREVLHLPAASALGAAFAPAMAFYARLVSRADDATVRADLARLPELLDYADGLIDAGTIGGTAPNAADFQILASLRLLLAQDDLRPLVERRRCGRAALALLPEFPRPGPGALPPIPAALPRDWIPEPDSEPASRDSVSS